jgi:hypothetical protein
MTSKLKPIEIKAILIERSKKKPRLKFKKIIFTILNFLQSSFLKYDLMMNISG